ncbi:MAG: hypothetical protein ACJA2S_002470 [Cyclobacteriaceae bacterium]|jgi:hypothetical protein
MIRIQYTLLSLFLLMYSSLLAQNEWLKAPARSEGEGPFSQLIIRGVTLINGTGSPPIGPVDVVVEQNRITQIAIVGAPGVEIKTSRRPKANPGAKIMEAEGMYLLPGFVDMHGHMGGKGKGATPEYIFKLWMGHGQTTIRDPGTAVGLEWGLEHKRKSNKNEITAPRILAYSTFGRGSKSPISTPQGAREWVRENAKKGSDGIKFFGVRPDIMEAALDENKKVGLRSACHHAQMNVAWQNALQSARMGLTTMEHWYGLPEAMFEDKTVQDYPVDYNYQNEEHRFGEAGRLWKQAAKPGSPVWNAVMDEMLELDFTLDPTFVAYDATRDVMRASRAEWHETYTLPALWEFYQPSLTSHGAYYHNWGTEQEVNWKQNYQLWMQFVNEYKNRGGRVTVGSDSGYTFNLYGFGFVRELELLREAGFHPLEVIRSATLYGAQALGLDKEIGSIEIGKLADMILVDENPIKNLKVLYGTGTFKLNKDNEVVRIGGIKYTIKDGIIYDSKKLLEDVRQMVLEAKKETNYSIYQPGMKKSQPAR